MSLAQVPGDTRAPIYSLDCGQAKFFLDSVEGTGHKGRILCREICSGFASLLVWLSSIASVYMQLGKL